MFHIFFPFFVGEGEICIILQTYGFFYFPLGKKSLSVDLMNLLFALKHVLFCLRKYIYSGPDTSTTHSRLQMRMASQSPGSGG